MKVEPAGQPEATAANASAIDAAPHVVPAEQLADALSCPICLGLLKDPLIAACCHNNFCRQCLKSSLLSKPECPLCRAPLVLENTLPNRAIRNLLPPEAQETADEGLTTFRQTTLLAGGKVPPACVLLLFMLSFASISFAPPRMPCFSTSFRTGGLWECHHASGTEAEPSLRGGRPLDASAVARVREELAILRLMGAHPFVVTLHDALRLTVSQQQLLLNGPPRLPRRC